MSLILAYKGRGLTRDITILDVNGGGITPGDSDKIRATIWRPGEAPVFTVTSDAATAAGSSFTKGAACRLRLDASDLNFEPGVYTLSIDLFDSADQDEWKVVSRQVLTLEDTEIL